MNTEIPVKSPRFAVFDLSEGKSYCFRVRCCNSAGIGEPSEATEATVVDDKLGKCVVVCIKLRNYVQGNFPVCDVIVLSADR